MKCKVAFTLHWFLCAASRSHARANSTQEGAASDKRTVLLIIHLRCSRGVVLRRPSFRVNHTNALSLNFAGAQIHRIPLVLIIKRSNYIIDVL